jgi:hypothetical protein
MDINKCCIIAQPRSGSSELCRILGSHSDMICHGEIFHPDGPQEYTGTWMGFGEEPIGYRMDFLIDHILGCDKKDGVLVKAIGFKILFTASQFQFVHLAISKCSHVIICVRPDLLAAFTSLQYATLTGNWQSKSRDQMVGQELLEFSTSAFLLYAAEMRDYFRRSVELCKNLDKPFTIFNYDHVFDSDEIGGLLDFLGLSDTVNVPQKHPVLDCPKCYINAKDAANFRDLAI